MKIARIKDRYMFHSRSWNTNKSHDYLIFKDNSSNEIRAIQLTYLYKKDRHRFMQVRISNKQKNDVIRFYNRPNEKKHHIYRWCEPLLVLLLILYSFIN